MTDNCGNDINNRKKVGFSWVGKHHLITTHDGRRRQRTVRYQTPSPRPKFRVVQGLNSPLKERESSKECSLFFLWTKKSFALPKLSFEEFNPVFFPAGLGLFWKYATRAAKFLKNFQLHLVLCGRENYIFKSEFMYL